MSRTTRWRWPTPAALQIELLQPRNDVPSMYRDFLRAGHAGAQHVAYWTEQFDADLQRAR